MTDKEKILAEIERKRQEINPLANFQVYERDRSEFYRKCEDYGLACGWINALKWMEETINSLSADSHSKN